MAIGNVKRVWGQASAEEVKAPETASTAAAASSNPTSLGGPGLQAPAQTFSTNKQAQKKQESKADKKKAKAAAALFGGISGTKDESSSDDSDDAPKDAAGAAASNPAQPEPQPT